MIISLIGSFRQNYDEILKVRKLFIDHGVNVISPIGTKIIENNIPFVRFISDDPKYEDFTIQSLTLKKLFISDIVYVVAPNGYVGRTTCYEIGRLIQAKKNLYFSEHPIDLPISISDDHIVSPKTLVKLIYDSGWTPSSLFLIGESENYKMERKLINE
jgi:hypothetical protein